MERLVGHYRQLLHGAVAAYLRRLGVGGEPVVGLLAERGADFLAAVLGVWRAGAAYLPLDVHHPGRRQRQVLAQGGVRLVLAGGGYAERLRAAVAEVGEGQSQGPSVEVRELSAALAEAAVGNRREAAAAETEVEAG